MRRYSFIITILGLFSLLLILIISQPIPIFSPQELSQLQENQKVLIQGIVIKELFSQNNKILTLNNEIQLICDKSCPNYLNKNITAIGTLSNFNKKNQIRILRIT
jgi:hypothetical protein